MKRLLLVALAFSGLGSAQQYATINGVANQTVVLPTPTTSALGGVEAVSQVSNEFVTYIDTSGVPHLAQPAFSNLSGSATTSQLPGSGATTVNGQTCTLGSSCTIPLSAVNPQTGTYQVLAGDFSNYKVITVASGTFNVTLVASGSQPAAGQYIWVVNYGSGAVSILRSGQNINGGTSAITLGAASATAPTTAQVWSDGTNYFASTSGVGTAAGVTSITGDGSLITNSSSSSAVTLTVGNAAGHKYWGNNTGSSTTASFVQPAFTDLTGSLGCGQVPTLTGDVTLSSCAATVGSIGGKSVTLGGSFTTSGAFGLTLTLSATTSLTLPTSGTLAILGKNTFTGTQTDAVNTVSSSSTPAFDLSTGNVQYIASLGTNATASFSNITTGGRWKFIICNNGTGGYTFTWPASVHGGMTIGTTASKCSEQDFASPDGSNVYAASLGVINQ